jgi:hypothetical protein
MGIGDERSSNEEIEKEGYMHHLAESTKQLACS